ncbi:MAG: SAM-dependent chlorinase/fluorinase [Holophagales bacterium]|nr:SAM-dependent chlorinase/fluorinase [Holophagales bacterium]
MAIVTLLTDFGLDDWYVAAVKGVILGRAPKCRIVDIGHSVPPQDIETASFLLEAAAPAFPAGTVHLAVVDPGVGTDRRILALARHDAFFLAPDNGLLTPFLGGASQVVAVERPDLYRSAPELGSGSTTFHGRDRFAPIAAALCLGEPLDELGPVLRDPVRTTAAPPRRVDGKLEGRIRHVDRFGNLVTDLPSSWLGQLGSIGTGEGALLARVGERSTELKVDCYEEIPPGRAAVLVGSLGTLELSLRGQDLSRAWGVGRGTPITVSPPGPPPRDIG